MKPRPTFSAKLLIFFWCSALVLIDTASALEIAVQVYRREQEAEECEGGPEHAQCDDVDQHENHPEQHNQKLTRPKKIRVGFADDSVRLAGLEHPLFLSLVVELAPPTKANQFSEFDLCLPAG